MFIFVVLMLRRPPISKRTDILFPYTTLFRAGARDAYYGRSLRVENPVDTLAHLGRLAPESYSWVHPDNPQKRIHLDYCFISAGLVPRLKDRSEEHTSELQSLIRISDDLICLHNKKNRRAYSNTKRGQSP